MKTLRYRIGNEVKPGISDAEQNIRDASSLVSDWDSDNVTVEKLSEIKNTDISSLPKVENIDGVLHHVLVRKVLVKLFV